MDSNDLAEQIRAASVPIHAATKAEVIHEYQVMQAEGQVKSWRKAEVSGMAKITGMKEHNLERRLDPSRLHTVPRSEKVKAQYQELGKTLPPIDYKAPPGGYRVTFNGWILIAGEYCEQRSFDRMITGDEADELASNPNFGTIFDEYFEEKGLAEETCKDPSLTNFSVRAA